VAGSAAAIVCAWLLIPSSRNFPADAAWAAHDADAEYGKVEIDYPFDQAVFPPEIVAPTFRWEDPSADSDKWAVVVEFQDDREPMSYWSESPEWQPSDGIWETMKTRSLERRAKATILGVNHRRPRQILSAGSVSFSTSKDEVGFPLFYREVHLPFNEAVSDPARHIRWRFGTIDSKGPPVVLKDLPNCANCHSFTADGSVLAMEVDSANDKGSYVIAPVAEEMVFDPAKIMTWSDYRREDEKPTFGLLPQISPDGRYAICMVKDRSVFVDRPGVAFSQLFFPIRGILVYYDAEKKAFQALPGADDPEYVQANPVWSPDGEYVVFARQKAYYLKHIRQRESILLSPNEVKEFLEEGKTFQYDLYRVPFNGGRGGRPEPIRGASENGKSNYFAKYSPDGKWIVFCQAKSFMLLQPDSELFIIPAEGGEARRLGCNTSLMNSWHSWSPDGKWLAFSSKALSPYTQLFLTHVDERGRTTTPVVLEHFTEPNKAANIPEFCNAKPGAIRRIRQEFLTDEHFYRAGLHALRQDDYDSAAEAYLTAIELNPEHVDARNGLAVVYMFQEKLAEAEAELRRVLEFETSSAEPYCNLGNVLAQQGMLQEALEPLRKALEIQPDDPSAHLVLGRALSGLGREREGRAHVAEAIRLNPRHAPAVRSVEEGDASLKAGEDQEAIAHYRRAAGESPDYLPALLSLASALAMVEDDALRNGEESVRLATDACEQSDFKDPHALAVLAAAYAEAGEFGDAVFAAERALDFAAMRGNEELMEAIGVELARYRAERPCRRSAAALIRLRWPSLGN
jgi:tetratricopeptide (TPR) repeat protein